MNTLNFDFQECNFTEKLMLKRDKKGVSREGAGRVAIYRECPGLVHSYTLECNYCCGAKLNKLEERFNLERRAFLSESEAVMDPRSALYQPFPCPTDSDLYQVRFSLPILHDIGRACLIAVLDLIHVNPDPRVSSIT
jgi:hypothetical protein